METIDKLQKDLYQHRTDAKYAARMLRQQQALIFDPESVDSEGFAVDRSVYNLQIVDGKRIPVPGRTPLQYVRTPGRLCKEMLGKLLESTTLTGKVVATVNMEFVYHLDNLPADRKPKEVWFYADNKEKGRMVQTFFPRTVIRYVDFLKEDATMKKFDVVAMNPPYQSADGGHARSSTPLYNLFIEKAIDELQPDYLLAVSPSRWMMGGKGLDTFRARMMADRHIKLIVDDMSCDGLFPSVDIAGGASYFLWDKQHSGKCNFNGVDRFLDEEDIVIRENESCSILKKVKKISTSWIGTGASPRKPYGLDGDAPVQKCGTPCWFKQSIGLAFVDPSSFTNARNDLQLWKVLVPRAPIAGQTDFSKPMAFFNDNNVILAKPGECCTETFIVIKSFATEIKAKNFISYLRTRFFRFMLRTRVISQDVTRETYNWVPDLEDYTKPWTDAELYDKFGLVKSERDYIESKIKAI